MPRLALSRGLDLACVLRGSQGFLGLTFCSLWLASAVSMPLWEGDGDGCDGQRIGSVVVARVALGAATGIPRSASTRRRSGTEGFAMAAASVYTPALGAEFASMTISPRTGRFSAQRGSTIAGWSPVRLACLTPVVVDLSVRGRGGGGPRPVSDGFTALDLAWEADMDGAWSGAGHPRRLWSGRPRLPGVPGVTRQQQLRGRRWCQRPGVS